PLVRIGSNVVVISAQIGHQSNLGDHCYIAAATLGGGVRVGEYAFIGMNATIREHVSVGRSCIIGAGATVLRDTKDDEVFRIRGTQPARAPSQRVRIMPDPKKPKRGP
ncbi:MAG: hypothetical protein OEQ18_11070, partial [Gammaproteobacteria bacterium]|nr:hypothetical protein [Gammaproteobacteria bacterium]